MSDETRVPDGWQGTPPVEGTRRKLILDTLEELSIRLISGNGGKPTSGSCLEAADAIEEALIRCVDNGATRESGSPASVAMDTLDDLGVPRTRDGAILTISDRVTVAADELAEARRQIDSLAAAVSARAGEPPAEGTRRKLIFEAIMRHRVFRIVGKETAEKTALELADDVQSALLQSTIDAEAMVRAGDSLTTGIESVEPPGEETRRRVIFRVLERLYKDKTEWPLTPQKVVDAIEAELLEAKELTDVDRLNSIAEERWKRIGELEEKAERLEKQTRALTDRLERDVERFLGEREEARTREGRFAEERDCAFALLRWLLPVTVAKRID